MTRNPRHRHLSEEYIVATSVFANIPQYPITCRSLSDDVNWMFFGAEVTDYPCDDMEMCRQCWPLCLYCWFTTDLDGDCDNEDCLTHEPWARRAADVVTGPPWFTGAFAELRRAVDQNPWRPPPTTRHRPPLAPRATDSCLYYPQALVATNQPDTAHLWSSIRFRRFAQTTSWPRRWQHVEPIF